MHSIEQRIVQTNDEKFRTVNALIRICSKGNPVRRLFLTFIFFILPVIGAAAPSVSSVAKEQHQAMHNIVFVVDDKDNFTATTCTAYSIAPHVLLTAAHCDIDNALLEIDPITPNILSDSWHREVKTLFGYVVVAKIFDGNDHMILVVPQANFKHTIDYDPDKYVIANENDYLYTWGNPYPLRDAYHKGKLLSLDYNVKHYSDVKCFIILLAAMHVKGGESGAAVFDANDNRLVTVITYNMQAQDGTMLMGGYPLDFTEHDVNMAKSISSK